MTELQKQQCEVDLAIQKYLKFLGWKEIIFGHYSKEMIDQCGVPLTTSLPPIMALRYELENSDMWVSYQMVEQYLEIKENQPATEPPTSPQPTQQDSAISTQSGAATANPDATMGMVWQPIALAPMDGSRLLGYNTRSGYYNPYVIISFSGDGFKDSHGAYPGATHWMPLPPAPTIVEQ